MGQALLACLSPQHCLSCAQLPVSGEAKLALQRAALVEPCQLGCNVVFQHINQSTWVGRGTGNGLLLQRRVNNLAGGCWSLTQGEIRGLLGRQGHVLPAPGANENALEASHRMFTAQCQGSGDTAFMLYSGNLGDHCIAMQMRVDMTVDA